MKQVLDKQALYWHPSGMGVQCELCPNRCLLSDEQLSSCRTRIAKGSKLYTLAYGNPIAQHIDPVEKKPIYHFKPGHRTYSIATAGCNLHCNSCQNASISQTTPSQRTQVISAQEIVLKALNAECDSISLTYTDPVAYYEYALDIAKHASSKHLPVIFVSAGYINHHPLRELIPYLTAANIDLKAMSDEFYQSNCSAHITPVLQTILSLHKSEVWLEITNLLIPGLNDQEEQIKALCVWMRENMMQDVPIHFSRFFPHHELQNTESTSEQTLQMAAKIAHQEGLNYVYRGNTSHASNTRCLKCGEHLIERLGYKTYILNGFSGTCPTCHEVISGLW